MANQCHVYGRGDQVDGAHQRIGPEYDPSTPDVLLSVTGSHDHTARVWDALTFAELATLTGHIEPVESVAVSPDGKRIFTGSSDGTALLQPLAISTACIRAPTKLSSPTTSTRMSG